MYDLNLSIEATNQLNWDNISWKQKLSEEFIEKHADKVDWNDIANCQLLSESFIEKHSDKMNWKYVSRRQVLSESFIAKHADKVDWNGISRHQKLSEKFIEKYSDKLDWKFISRFQKVSEEFIKKHFDKIENYNLLNVVHYCGHSNKAIFITKDEPEIINIGCFSGTKEEVISKINEEYSGQDAEDYISKVIECFNIQV